MTTCPYCKEKLKPSNGRHIYGCKKRDKSLSMEELYFHYIRYNHPEISNQDLLNELYIGQKKSLPDIRKKYGIGYRAIVFLLNYYKIPRRGYVQAFHECNGRRKETNTEKYGAVNVLSKNTKPYLKRNRTVKNRYGVNNVFELSSVKEKIENDAVYLDKYGLTFSRFRSRRSKAVWESKSDEQKDAWLQKTLFINLGKGRQSSKLETRIGEILYEKNITHTVQFYKSGKYFDFLLPDLKLIIEVNGDYWHANPRKYKASDIILYFGETKTAQQVWDKDKNKEKRVLDLGYKIIYIWEDEMKDRSDGELLDLLLRRIEEQLCK